MLKCGLLALLLCLAPRLQAELPGRSFAPFKRGSISDSEVDGSSLFGSKQRNPEREQLYEAYNLLHTLAQVRAISRWSDYSRTRGYMSIDSFKTLTL